MSKCEFCSSEVWADKRERIDQELLKGASTQWVRKWVKDQLGIDIPLEVLWIHYQHLEDEHRKKSPIFREFGFYP
jgi:hypothetical protein